MAIRIPTLKRAAAAMAAFLALPALLAAQTTHPKIVFPDAGEYKVLKCDFHCHTLFSDGTVWPTERVYEARMEGLDAIAITDHIEHRPYKDIVIGDHNKSYELAAKTAGKKLIVIKGGEISRGMPPGHWNALFIKDANKLDTTEVIDAFDETVAQGGFLVWNHPGWERQAPNRTVMLPEHKKYLKAGYMMGIEIFNECYYPEAFKWALDHDLTLMSGTDCHAPMSRIVNYSQGEHRPVTLVLATERSGESIHEALIAHRTAVYVEDELYGRERELEAILSGVLTVVNTSRSADRASITLRNESSMPVYLCKAKGSEDLVYERDFKIRPFETRSIAVRPVKDEFKDGALVLNFCVKNFHTSPKDTLTCRFVIE